VLTRLELETIAKEPYKMVIECYPGVLVDEFIVLLKERFKTALIVDVAATYKTNVALKAQFAEKLTDDPVFGFMYPWEVKDFFDSRLMEQQRVNVTKASGLCFIVGTGASLIEPNPNLLVHAGVARWEIQQRQRAHRIGNLGLNNAGETPARLYKNAFFIDWRVADRLRHRIYNNVDFFLDLNCQEDPRMVDGEVFRNAVKQAVHRPFRVVPFFDPGPWGGDWMYKHFNLPDGPPNYAWCFDCVPEENSVVFGFGEHRFELPSLILVHEHPLELLGERVYKRFGAEFPIRFDFLDTMHGGNLSLQVHPMTDYIRRNFGMDYTQDESYYILDSEHGARVYLGLRDRVDKDQMSAALRDAQTGGAPFDAERFVTAWPAQKHDHFLIPAGTIHCSGKDSVVLEISATPYIFTFKLWDWGRMGLNGEPRPIHLEHGLKNIQWNRTTEWVRKSLIGQVQQIEKGEGWEEERTGLHEAEFIETRRHWFVSKVQHHTHGNLNVLNLVEGDEVVLESPTGAFAPLHVHYAETVILPAAVGKYTIRPLNPTDRPLATLKAYVREDASFNNEKELPSSDASDVNA
jgi:mannose-6-phosphate isomerase class I